MKTMLSIVIVSVAAVVATPSFAQSTSQSPAGSVVSSSDVAQQSATTWQPDGQASSGKTRAQVYQELIHAQQDGQLAYLDRTLYAHH